MCRTENFGPNDLISPLHYTYFEALSKKKKKQSCVDMSYKCNFVNGLFSNKNGRMFYNLTLSIQYKKSSHVYEFFNVNS